MDLKRGEMVEVELERLIERRFRNGDVGSGEQRELWKQSVRAYSAHTREQMRAAWCEHHQEQAARLRTNLEALKSATKSKLIGTETNRKERHEWKTRIKERSCVDSR